MREIIGDLGHFSVLISFMSSLVAGIAYFIASTTTLEKDKLSWTRFGRIAFGIHAVSVLSIIVSLFIIIHSHYYEYHYAWNHSSNDLPVHYMISCFWEGQEGSFLLWIFWHVVLGIILLFTSKKWEATVFTVFFAVQFCLTSMILGVAFGDFRIGSSPFILLKEVMQTAPIYLQNPNFIPEDGTGLNPLLQNYWMVIHPPTLFMGFALTLVPFAYAVSALWKGEFVAWLKPALRWSVMAALILGTGIIMGAYWAYETLNFGGYWNWDPVENAVYVPWLILVAAIHAMILFNKHKTVLKTSFVLVLSTFILILYSTFLTRSGVLGDTSVHSFTDLGLSFQLGLFLSVFALAAVVFYQIRRRQIPGDSVDIGVHMSEFWILSAVLILSVGAFQVLLGTSIPFFNNVFGSSIAPPTNQVQFYSRFQIWMGILIAAFAVIGQKIYWNRVDKAYFKKWGGKYLLVSVGLVATSLVILLIYSQSSGYLDRAIQDIKDQNNEDGGVPLLVLNLLSYVLLLAFGIYSIISSVGIIFRLAKNSNGGKIGGAVAHTGVALMLIGILFSAAYDKVVSINRTGLLLSKEQSQEFNVENLLLWRHDKTEMGEYELTYVGRRMESLDFPGHLEPEQFVKVIDDKHALAREDIYWKGKKYFEKGDTFRVSPENFYYEILYKDDTDEEFTLYPRIQINPAMGGLLASPDVKKLWTKDLYTYISSIANPNEEKNWSDTLYSTIAIGDTFFLNDFVAVLDTVSRIYDFAGTEFHPKDIALQAKLKILSQNEEYFIKPILLLYRGDFLNPIPIPDENEDVGIKTMFSFAGTTNEQNIPEFKFASNTTQLDYVILKVVEKPMINLLWIGTIITIIGFGISFFRRLRD